MLLGTTTTVNSVLPAAGTTTVAGPTLTIPAPTAPGLWHVLMVADDLGNVAESSETDNVADLLIQVLPASVAFVTPLSLGVANEDLPLFKVSAKDASGAALPAVNVTLTLGTDAGGGVLSGILTRQTDAAGEATFNDIRLSRGGDGYTVVATTALAGAPSATSGPFYVVGFGNAPNNIHGRFGHAATLLSDGRVLVSGGSGSPAAEIYDPATNGWSVTGSMIVIRSKHTATLLADGRVLIAGGLSTTTGTVLSSAEIYDPAAGTFLALSDTLASPRTDHRAVLLTNGKVLITGGSIGAPGNPVSVATADLFDPATSEFTATAPMDIARELHTMTPLADGRVLVAGGRTCVRLDGGGSGCTFRNSALVYDATGAAVTAVGTMATERTTQAASMLGDGRVLVSGGFGAGALSASELFAPGPATFAATGAMNAARYTHTSTLLEDGSVLVTGGFAGAATLDTAERCLTAAGEWLVTPNAMAFSRGLHTATRLPNGKVLIVGGGAVMAELFHPYPPPLF